MLSFSGSESTEPQLWPRPVPIQTSNYPHLPTIHIYHVFEMYVGFADWIPTLKICDWGFAW